MLRKKTVVFTHNVLNKNNNNTLVGKLSLLMKICSSKVSLYTVVYVYGEADWVLYKHSIYVMLHVEIWQFTK